MVVNLGFTGIIRKGRDNTDVHPLLLGKVLSSKGEITVANLQKGICLLKIEVSRTRGL